MFYNSNNIDSNSICHNDNSYYMIYKNKNMNMSMNMIMNISSYLYSNNLCKGGWYNSTGIGGWGC